MKRLNEKGAPQRTARSSTAMIGESSSTPANESQPVKPSWRDFYAVHSAAAFYHGFSSDEQLEELTADIDKQRVIFDPIHTVTVFGKTFVIDGISRLDAIEKTKRQIVDGKGNWIGVLDGKVVHHPGKTDEEVWEIVRSLNDKRRHLTVGQRALIAERMATGAHGGDRKTDQKLVIAFDHQRTIPSNRKIRVILRTIEQAAETMHVSPASVKQVRKVRREAPDKLKKIKTGKLSPSKALRDIENSKPKKGKLKKEVPFEDGVWKKWTTWINRFPHARRREVMIFLTKQLLGYKEIAGAVLEQKGGPA